MVKVIDIFQLLGKPNISKLVYIISSGYIEPGYNDETYLTFIGIRGEFNVQFYTE